MGRRRAAPTISLSALVDVLFILIVFVILAADFDRTRALEIELPGSATAEIVNSDVARLLVPSQGPLSLDGTAFAETELATHLRSTRGQRTELVIVADGDIPLRRATAIIDAGTRAGYQTVSVATRAEQP